jgi:ABC-type multidrug transport system ATPase subunit
MINSLADRGTAILVTTHYLEEAEQCNRLGFMVAGELVAEGTPRGVKDAQGGHLIEFLVNDPQYAADLLRGEEDRWRVSLFGDRLPVIVDQDAEHPSSCRSVSHQRTTRDHEDQRRDRAPRGRVRRRDPGLRVAIGELPEVTFFAMAFNSTS